MSFLSSWVDVRQSQVILKDFVDESDDDEMYNDDDDDDDDDNDDTGCEDVESDTMTRCRLNRFMWIRPLELE